MTEKVFYIHAGGSKTGSSALQNFFYTNATRLESVDFAFEYKNTAEFGTNNGMMLYKALSSAAPAEEEIDRLVSSYFGRCNNAICSSEYFQLLEARGWRKLLGSLRRLDAKITLIFYVRNVLPFFLSSYDQAIKCHGEQEVFESWVIRQDWQHASGLKRMAAELPESSIQVLHFENEKANLIRSFLTVLGIDSLYWIDQRGPSKRVNRSLNNEEREALLTINKALGQAYSAELTQLLTSRNPNQLAEPVFCRKSTAEVLRARFSNEVDWVNNTFFNGQTVVSILPNDPEKDLSKNSLTTCQQHHNVQKDVLNWALEKLNTIQSETAHRIVKTLNNAAMEDSVQSHPELPVDFDALAYLLINPDVLYACFDPVQHYLMHGKQEGRIYRFIKK